MIDERQVRDMLKRRAETISRTPTDEPKAIRRARRRLALNATVGGLMGVVLVAGAFAGLRTIQAWPTSLEPATRLPAPAKPGSLAYGVDGDIYVSDSDGSNRVRIADGRPASECGGPLGEYWGEGPMWSPDGRYLAYRHADCPDDWHANVVISDPEGNVVARFPGEGWDIGWSPDSTRVAVWISLPGGTIGVYGLDGKRQATLTVPPEMREAGDYDPIWLPDGRSLFLPQVVLPIDGSTPYRPPSAAAVGTYSPDGSRVAYVVERSLVVAEADGSNPRVVFDEGVSNLAWSPDGDRLAVTSLTVTGERRSSELRVVDLSTGEVTLLGEADGIIDFSPQGDRILFSTGDEPVVSSLWSVGVDGSDRRRLVAATAWGDWLSPDPML